MKWISLWIGFALFGMAGDVLAESQQDPCGGPDALLSIIDRPTVGDSACVVPYKNVVLEVGYQYQQLRGGGYEQNLPEAELRIGLPCQSEFVLLLPNFIQQTLDIDSGLSATVVGVKHRLGSSDKWVASVEGLFALPSGSDEFGSASTGFAFNGIYYYGLNSEWSVSFMFGISTQTQSENDGGGRYSSLNPDLVVTWAPTDKLNFYVEFYAQSKTSPSENFGMNCDGGLIYLLCKNMAIDVEMGQHISGNLSSFENYVGTGFSVLFN